MIDLFPDPVSSYTVIKVINRLKGHYGNFRIVRSDKKTNWGKNWQAYCQATDFDELEFTVCVRPSCEPLLFIENLIHEVAHVVAATRNPNSMIDWSSRNTGHDDAWGLAYAEVYRVAKLGIEDVPVTSNSIKPVIDRFQ